MKCPKCGGEMETGVTLDAYDVGMYNQSKWSEGMTKTLGIFVGHKGEKQITTYRCKICGYLESYAK